MIRNDVADYGYKIPPEEYAVSPERVLGMDTREVMISDVLKKQGYKNAVLGKWAGGSLKRYLPLQRGFDEFYGLVNTGIDYYTHERYSVPSMLTTISSPKRIKGLTRRICSVITPSASSTRITNVRSSCIYRSTLRMVRQVWIRKFAGPYKLLKSTKTGTRIWKKRPSIKKDNDTASRQWFPPGQCGTAITWPP